MDWKYILTEPKITLQQDGEYRCTVCGGIGKKPSPGGSDRDCFDCLRRSLRFFPLVQMMWEADLAMMSTEDGYRTSPLAEVIYDTVQYLDREWIKFCEADRAAQEARRGES